MIYMILCLAVFVAGLCRGTGVASVRLVHFQGSRCIDWLPTRDATYDRMTWVMAQAGRSFALCTKQWLDGHGSFALQEISREVAKSRRIYIEAAVEVVPQKIS